MPTRANRHRARIAQYAPRSRHGAVLNVEAAAKSRRPPEHMTAVPADGDAIDKSSHSAQLQAVLPGVLPDGNVPCREHAHGLPHAMARNLQMASTTSTEELVSVGASIALGDGSRVRLRQLDRSDGELLVRGFERLTAESRYQRFLMAMPELTAWMVRYLTDIDHHDHEAIIALDELGGECIGVGRYVRDPERPNVAEVAVTVIDEWQGRGLGTALLDLISTRARDEGVTTFKALILATNEEMMALLRHLASARIVDREPGRVEIEVPIPTVGTEPALRKLFQIAAHGDEAVPLARRGSPAAVRARRRTRPAA